MLNTTANNLANTAVLSPTATQLDLQKRSQSLNKALSCSKQRFYSNLEPLAQMDLDDYEASARP